jgi:hypothetical protein
MPITRASRKNPYRLQAYLTEEQRAAFRLLAAREQKSFGALLLDLLEWKAALYPEVAEALASEKGR